jgi:Na+-driven multidrug efflux pump
MALPMWVGNALPQEAITVGRWLCLGVWINSIGSMYFSLLHAQGRFKATGILHMIELPLYIFLLLALLRQFGVVGAAVAWSMRVTVDSVCLAWLARLKSR